MMKASTGMTSMTSMTVQRQGLAAAAVARVHAPYAAANGLMGNGSWSIPCFVPTTDHKPRPRRPQVIPS